MKQWLDATQLDRITSCLQSRLSPRRVTHTFGACHTAVILALRWGADPSEALAAALFHDIAKEEPRDLQRARIERVASGAMPEAYAEQPSLWHALAAVAVAREEFGLANPAVERAIRLHPTADGEMTVLDAIIFLADYTESMRSWEGVEALRALARRDLWAAVDQAVVGKTQHVARRGQGLHECSRRALHTAKERMAVRGC